MIDVLAASIEYGLDGLTKVRTNDKPMKSSQNLACVSASVVCSIHERINSSGHSMRVHTGTILLPYFSS